jgi:hypothetical protein
MIIHDIVHTLPWNPNGSKWTERNVDRIKYLVVHQALGTKTVENTNAYHISPECHIALGVGLPHIAYHYFIDYPDGTIYKCNNRSDLLFHVKGYNLVSVGICLGGWFDYGDEIGRDGNPTKQQLDALTFLLDYLLSLLKLNRKAVCTHDSLQDKPACPGNMLTAFVDNYRRPV